MNAILSPYFDMSHKSSILATVAAACTAALVLLSTGGANAQEKTTYVGPSVSFVGGGSLIGVNAKFKVADSISVRPFIQFGTVAYPFGFGNESITIFGASATYDLNIPRSDFNPYAGVGYQSGPGSKTILGFTAQAPISSGIFFEVGTDYNISDSIALNASYRIKDSGSFNLGGAYRF